MDNFLVQLKGEYAIRKIDNEFYLLPLSNTFIDGSSFYEITPLAQLILTILIKNSSIDSNTLLNMFCDLFPNHAATSIEHDLDIFLHSLMKCGIVTLNEY